MRLAYEPQAARIARRAKWHRWFAWRPVKVAPGDIRWMETIDRRGGFDHRPNTDRRPPWRWEYRAA